MNDVERNTEQSLHCNGIYFISRQGEAYAHRSSPWPRTEEELASGELLSTGRLIDELAEDRGFVFNLLHGNEGEDGAWQGVAEVANIFGSFGSVFAAAITMNKWAQSLLAAIACGPRLRHPEMWRLGPFAMPEEMDRVLAQLGGRICVVKPNRMGASLLTECYESLTSAELRARVADIARFDTEVLVQEYIAGDEYTCGCIERDGQVVALPVIQAITERRFLGHAEKHRKGLVHAHLILEDTHTTAQLKAISCSLFREFGLSTVCRFDYIVTSEGEPYFLEANSIPGLMHGSAFPKMLAAVGLDCADIVRISVETALRQSRRCKVLPYSIDD